jgi:hypothetical protein
VDVGAGGRRPGIVEECLPTFGGGFRAKDPYEDGTVESGVGGQPLLNVVIAPEADLEVETIRERWRHKVS